MEKFAKIICTLGPSSQDDAMIRQMIDAGMDVARLNFSHGTLPEHGYRIQQLRRISSEVGKPITILQDLQGPKMRVGALPGGKVALQAGQRVILATDPDHPASTGNDHLLIPFDFPELSQAVQRGSHILLDDGHLELQVDRVGENGIEAIVILGGFLSSHKGVNLPGTTLALPGFTEKDEQDLAFGLEQGIDIVAVSFVRTASDIEIVREAICRLSPQCPDIPIIAKVEKPEALENLDAILDAADGVMVARGDLGVEISPAAVPIAQKKIIMTANQHQKMVITATQMLDSMINNPRPTRAEASDVANAIFDGTDAVMLSGETASGKYPLESVRIMAAITCEAEHHYSDWGHPESRCSDDNQDDAVSITRAARELAHDRNVAAIAVFTETGRTALLMSKARPMVPVFAFSPSKRTYQRMGLYWGVKPFLIPYASSLEEMSRYVEQTIQTGKLLQPGQQVVLISGFPVGEKRLPNLALLHTVGH